MGSGIPYGDQEFLMGTSHKVRMREKRFSDFAQNWLICSSDGMTKSIFTVKRENFLMGLKIDFEVENLGFLGLFFVIADQFTKEFNVKKSIFRFC